MQRTKQYLSFLGGLALWVSPLCALGQDYIDVEAERLGQQQDSAEATYTVPPPADTAESGGNAGSNFGDLFYQLQLLQQEVMELRGQVEEQAYQLRQLKEQSLERYLDLDRRLSGDEGADGTAGAGSGAEQTPAEELAGEADAYRAAYSLVRSQQFSDAILAFRQFLIDYPGGRYTPNAHYWLGELHLVVVPPDGESARRQFNLLLDDYPDNAKVPDALYKLGRIHFDRGERDRAREYFERVINEFGDSNSSAVKLARDFIDSNF